MSERKALELPIAGMDCAECTQHVRHAIAALPGVASVEVYLAAEKATLRIDPSQVSLDAIRQAVKGAGYSVPEPARSETGQSGKSRQVLGQGGDFARQVSALLAILFGVVLFIVVAGEWLGLFERLTERVPWPLGMAIVLGRVLETLARASEGRKPALCADRS